MNDKVKLEKLNEAFGVFKETWDKHFQTNTKMKVTDFKNMFDWLKWVVSQDGITEKNRGKALYFNDYVNFKFFVQNIHPFREHGGKFSIKIQYIILFHHISSNKYDYPCHH